MSDSARAGHVDGRVVHMAGTYVSNRDDLNEFHYQFDGDGPGGADERHTSAWTDSGAWTHCICFGAAVRAVEPLVAALHRIAEGDLPEHMSAGAFADAVLRQQDVSGPSMLSDADEVARGRLGPHPSGGRGVAPSVPATGGDA